MNVPSESAPSGETEELVVVQEEDKPPKSTSVERSDSTKAAPPEGEAVAGTSTEHPLDEVFRVNRLLQIENLDWTHQLEQAVSGFF